MKKFNQLWLPGNEQSYIVRYTDKGKRYSWNSGNKKLVNLNTGNSTIKNFTDVFNPFERHWIKTKLNSPKHYANAAKKLIRSKGLQKNYRVEQHGDNILILYNPNTTGQTYVRTRINNPYSLTIESGKTSKNFRGRGIGKTLRALMTLAAKQAGFKSVNQTSVFSENEQRKNHALPPSSYIMTGLGFNQTKSTVSNNIYHHKYNFTTKKNNSKLWKALNTKPAKQGILGRIKNARIKHIKSRLNQANKLVKESQNSGMNKSFPRLYKGLVSKRNKLQNDLKKLMP